MFKGKRVFISGGAGVIGTALVERLYEMGAILYVGDIKPRPENWPSEIIYRQGDLNFISKGELDISAPEYFFHLAATFERSVETYDFWDENYQHNIKLSHHLMTCLKDSISLRKVIFASSYLIYNPDLYNFSEPALKPIRLCENEHIYPRNLTGVAKLLHEIELRFLSDFSHAGFTMVAARIYRVYGKNSRDVISRWIRSLLNGETITVYNKEGMFDYIYAGDVAEGLLKLAGSQVTGIINLGREHSRRVEEVLTALKVHFPDMKFTEVEADIPYEASEADMSRFKELIGWVPKRDIEEMIPELLKYERNNLFNQKSKNTKINTLVTSVSSKVPLIKSLKKAYLKLGCDGNIIGADHNFQCIGRNFVDDFWEMPELDELPFETFLRYCNANDIKAVIPTRDGELPFFAKYKKQLQANGIDVMVSEPKVSEACLDKLLFYKKLEALGYPVIQTVKNINELDCKLYVVKECFGAGSRSLGLCLSKDEASKHAQSLQAPIFQPFVEGKEFSVDLYVDLNGKAKGVIVRARELVINGESQITSTCRNPKLEKLSINLVEELGLYGHIVLQVLIDEKEKIHIIECNSRFGGASTLSQQAGLDSFYWFLLESVGVDITNYPFLRTHKELRQIRYAEDLILE